MGIKNNSLTYQAHVYKWRKAKIQKLNDEIKELKKDFRINVNQILEMEHELAAVIEKDLKRELAQMKTFDRLNNEKVTPHFMTLTKNNKNESSLLDIHKDDGSPFDSTTEQHTYITEFYKNLYKKQQDSVDPQTIGDFLGHITTHEVVRNAKLNDREKNALDNPLTLIELDQSINDANMNSALGINGISNKFIKKYWELFRYPLFNCANHMFVIGTMPDSFKTAKIKLIPKKGDCGKLKQLLTHQPFGQFLQNNITSGHYENKESNR